MDGPQVDDPSNGKMANETATAEKGQEDKGKENQRKYDKDMTLQIELQGTEKVTIMELLKCVQELCSGLMACRYTGENKYEVIMTNAMGKRRLLDGFKIGTTTVLANKLDNDELVVSFLGLPAYITDKEILDKLYGWGVSAVSPIKRRMWPGTNIADGTRYLKLYSSSPVRQYDQEMVIKAITNKLGTEDKVWCDQPLTTSEIEATISGLHKNKSPGIDGLTTDFFQAFKDKLSPILQSVFQEIDSRGYAPETLTSGLITIVYKNKGDKTNLQNYRPISLLNTDYKILTKALANKLKTVIPGLVHQAQAYSIPNRDISDPILSTKSALSQMSNSGGIYLGVDFEKAFDCVEHEFLWATLKQFGFGQSFRKTIQVLYNNAHSQLKINGLLTPKIKINRSIRQGCPLSSLLYSLVAEPLALLINQNQSIQGIRADNGAVCKMISYADDTNIMVKDEKSLNVALDIIDNYCAASGAKINEKKSTIMYCGAVARSPGRWQFREEKACVRVLGVYLGCDGVAARDQTWHEVLEKIKKTLGMWKMRKLTLKGKVVVLNSLILSKLNHVLQIYDLPEQTLTEINNAISTFLWGSRRNMIAHKTIINKQSNGGLNLIDIKTRKHCFRVKIIKKTIGQ
ncbi:hypothetical protein JOB18_024398 [Solea senegalensis]|uniref:Reverse transcriptase domain-containing protein n=1 Tax=Solea senegalensis TaxID=28829 RepID=A0AAV6QXF4_SOLSE|nr:hypothetical protein JOB18_024398 [Solea senegalensis]